MPSLPHDGRNKKTRSSQSQEQSLGALTTPATAKHALELLETSVSRFEEKLKSEVTLVDVVLASDDDCRRAVQLRLKELSECGHEARVVSVALHHLNLAAQEHEAFLTASDRLFAAEATLKDLLVKASHRFSTVEGSSAPHPRLSEAQMHELTNVMHEHRRRFWTCLGEFPLVLDNRIKELQQFAEGSFSMQDVFLIPRAATWIETNVRNEVAALLADIRDTRNAHEGVLPRADRRRFAEKLVDLPMKPETALTLSSVVERHAKRYTELEKQHSERRDDKRSIVAPREHLLELAELEAGLGAGPAEARAAVHHLLATRAPYIQIKEYLFLTNTPLVGRFLRSSHFPAGLHEDLSQAAAAGLLKAVERFEPSSGFRFSTCGSMWIQQSFRLFLRDCAPFIRVPAHLLSAFYDIKKSVDPMTGSNTREFSEQLGIRVDQFESLVRVSRPLASLFSVGLDDDSPTPLHARLPGKSEEPLGKRIELEEISKILRENLDTLPEREKLVLKSRFGLDRAAPMTLVELGDVLGVSKERVRQLERQALNRLSWIMRKLEPLVVEAS